MIGTRNRRTAQLIAAGLVACLGAQLGGADPLHKVGSEGAWQHEQSGWVFPRRIGDFTRVAPPYEIDGTYDVGARYERTVNHAQTYAVVNIYAADSAATDAHFDGAKTTTERSMSHGTLATEEPYSINARAQMSGVKVTYAFDAEANRGKADLYFIETAQWIVTIRTVSDGSDSGARLSLDRFVKELPWETLGSDPGDLHRAGL